MAEDFKVGDGYPAVVMVSIIIVLFLLLMTGVVLVIRDTVRKRGRWGINFRPMHCPNCNEPAPTIRRPKNRRQVLWGGCTCEQCGTEYDKWGQPIIDTSRTEDKPTAASDLSP